LWYNIDDENMYYEGQKDTFYKFIVLFLVKNNKTFLKRRLKVSRKKGG